MLLIADIRANRRFVRSYGRNEIAPGPEVHPGEILAPPQIVAGDVNGALAFDEPNHLNRSNSRTRGGSMGNSKSLSHTRWDCKYHLVWVPKGRRKVLYGQLRKYHGQVLHELAGQKESQILEGHLQADHVHVLVSIPPKYSVAL